MQYMLHSTLPLVSRHPIPSGTTSPSSAYQGRRRTILSSRKVATRERECVRERGKTPGTGATHTTTGSCCCCACGSFSQKPQSHKAAPWAARSAVGSSRMPAAAAAAAALPARPDLSAGRAGPYSRCLAQRRPVSDSIMLCSSATVASRRTAKASGSFSCFASILVTRFHGVSQHGCMNESSTGQWGSGPPCRAAPASEACPPRTRSKQAQPPVAPSPPAQPESVSLPRRQRAHRPLRRCHFPRWIGQHRRSAR